MSFSLQNPQGHSSHHREHCQLELKEKCKPHTASMPCLKVAHITSSYILLTKANHSAMQKVIRWGMCNPLIGRGMIVRSLEFEWIVNKSATVPESARPTNLWNFVWDLSPSHAFSFPQWVLLWDHMGPFILGPHLLVRAISFYTIFP